MRYDPGADGATNPLACFDLDEIERHRLAELDPDELAHYADLKRLELESWERAAPAIVLHLSALIDAPEPDPWTREGKGIAKLRADYEKANLCGNISVDARNEEEADRIYKSMPQREQRIAVFRIVEPHAQVFYRHVPVVRPRLDLRLCARAHRSSSSPRAAASDATAADAGTDGPAVAPDSPRRRLARALRMEVGTTLFDLLALGALGRIEDEEDAAPSALAVAQRAREITDSLVPREGKLLRAADPDEGEADIDDALGDPENAALILASWIYDFVNDGFDVVQGRLTDDEAERLDDLLKFPDAIGEACVRAWRRFAQSEGVRRG